MPCRALEAFRRKRLRWHTARMKRRVLMPCRALEAFRLRTAAACPGRRIHVLMPCRALEAFRQIYQASASAAHHPS